MAAYSLGLRKRVLRAWDSGMDAEGMAAKHEASRAWVHRLRRWQDLQPQHDARHYVLLESDVTTDPLRRYGLNPRGPLRDYRRVAIGRPTR